MAQKTYKGGTEALVFLYDNPGKVLSLDGDFRYRFSNGRYQYNCNLNIFWASPGPLADSYISNERFKFTEYVEDPEVTITLTKSEWEKVKSTVNGAVVK